MPGTKDTYFILMSLGIRSVLILWVQHSIHGNFYMGAIMDTATKHVFPSFIETKDQVHDKLSWFFETYIVALRGRSNTNYEIFLITDLGEAHTNKII